MDNFNTENEIKIMLSCKIRLESTDSNLCEYNDIYNLIKKFLLKYCNHNIIEDYIDISPDNCQCIKYCTKCESTFH